MPTENYDYMNLATDYINRERYHAKKQGTHEKNTTLNKKYGQELSDNEHLTKVTDIMPYPKLLKPYQQPIVEVLEGDLRKRVLEQLQIESQKPNSKNMKISYGPRTYRLAV